MKEISTEDFIKQLHIILFDLNVIARQTADKLQQDYGWTDNDARIYFFNAVGQTCFLHGMTINFINKDILLNNNKWRENQDYFTPSGDHDFEGIVFNYSGLVRDNFFVDFIILLEHALRIFGEKINPQITSDKIATIKDQIIKQLGLDTEYKKLFDIIFKLRNTIHNAGLHSDDKPSITYKGKTFEFFEKKETQSSLENIEFLFNEALVFMTELFNHDASKNVADMEHPYKPLFDPASQQSTAIN